MIVINFCSEHLNISVSLATKINISHFPDTNIPVCKPPAAWETVQLQGFNCTVPDSLNTDPISRCLRYNSRFHLKLQQNPTPCENTAGLTCAPSKQSNHCSSWPPLATSSPTNRPTIESRRTLRSLLSFYLPFLRDWKPLTG